MLRTKSALLLGALFASKLTAQACFDNNLGTDLNMADDQVVQGLSLGFTFNYNGIGYTQVCVDSNGSVYLGGTTTQASDWTPSEAEFLASTSPRLCPMWGDYSAQIAGSGHIFFNAVPAAGSNPAYATVTWNDVWEFNRPNRAVKFQVRLDANSQIQLYFGQNGAQGGTLNPTVITGITPGAGAVSNPQSLATRPAIIAANSWSWTQNVSPTSFALANFTTTWLPTNPGFVITDSTCQAPASAVVVGTGCYFVQGQSAGDDTTHLVNLPFSFPHASGAKTQIYVSSNGFLSLTSTDPGNGCCNGDVPAMLAGAPRVAALWMDNNAGPTGAGEVYTGIETSSGAFVVTWLGVPEFVNVGSNNFQIALYPSGDIQIRYGTVASSTHTAVAGYSDGNGAADPGPTDLSTAGPGPIVNTVYESFAPATVDLSGLNLLLVPNGAGAYIFLPGSGSPFSAPSLPLALDPAPLSTPRINTTFSMDVSNISPPPNGNVVFLKIGFTEIPGGADLGVIGAPGCNAYVLPSSGDLDFLNITLGAPTTTFNIPVPNNTALIGVVGIAEAYSDTVGANSLGFRFSNGLRLTVGP